MHLHNFHSKHFKTLKTTLCCGVCSWLDVRRMLLRSIRRTPSQLQQIPTQHDMLPQHLVYKNELNREYVITLVRNDETP